jgi:hypothetical protein
MWTRSGREGTCGRCAASNAPGEAVEAWRPSAKITEDVGAGVHGRYEQRRRYSEEPHGKRRRRRKSLENFFDGSSVIREVSCDPCGRSLWAILVGDGVSWNLHLLRALRAEIPVSAGLRISASESRRDPPLMGRQCYVLDSRCGTRRHVCAERRRSDIACPPQATRWDLNTRCTRPPLHAGWTARGHIRCVNSRQRRRRRSGSAVCQVGSTT